MKTYPNIQILSSGNYTKIFKYLVKYLVLFFCIANFLDPGLAASGRSWQKFPRAWPMTDGWRLLRIVTWQGAPTVCVNKDKYEMPYQTTALQSPQPVIWHLEIAQESVGGFYGQRWGNSDSIWPIVMSAAWWCPPQEVWSWQQSHWERCRMSFNSVYWFASSFSQNCIEHRGRKEKSAAAGNSGATCIQSSFNRWGWSSALKKDSSREPNLLGQEI